MAASTSPNPPPTTSGNPQVGRPKMSRKERRAGRKKTRALTPGEGKELLALAAQLKPTTYHPGMLAGPPSGLSGVASDVLRRSLRAMYPSDQVVRVHLNGIPQQVVSNGASGMDLTYQITLGNMQDAASWAAVFDEFRFVRATCHYTPALSGSSSAQGVFALVCDYDSTGAITSNNIALAYDNVKVFPSFRDASLVANFRAPPDDSWTSTASSSVSFTTFKFWGFTSTGVGATVTYGLNWVQAEVEFRTVN